jgi:hypothetical protein
MSKWGWRYSPIPKIFMPKKTQRIVYAKGQSVFELIDPEGHIYVTASSRCKR